MFTLPQIVQVAETLQPQATQYLTPDQNTQLQTLITQAKSGQPVENDILEILASHEQLREQASNLLENLNAVTDLRGFDPLASDSALVTNSLIYRCSKCDYITDIPFLGMTPDPCPDHPTTALISG